MKKILLIILLAGGGYLAWRCLAPSPSRSGAEPALNTVEVQRGNITLAVDATATITPENKLEIKPPVAGRAETVLVEIGTQVKQGQVLATMSSDERAALLDAARGKGAKELKFWEDIYKAAPLVAPLDGEIISRSLIPGQVVQSTDVVFIMSDHLIAQADLDETDIAKIRMAQQAIVTLDSYPDEKSPGHVSKIAYDSTTTNNVTTYKVDVTFEKIPPHARSGMTANVAFILDQRKDVLVLPADAIRDGSTVLLAPEKPGSVPQSHSVKVGLTDGKQTEIVAGLSEGQKVVAAGYALPEEPNQGMSILPKAKGSSGQPPP